MTAAHFELVGCSECSAEWIIAADPTQVASTCPQCGHDHLLRYRKTLDRAPTREALVDERAERLARRAEKPGRSDLYANLSTFGIDDLDSFSAARDRVDGQAAADVMAAAAADATGVDADVLDALADERHETAEEAHWRQLVEAGGLSTTTRSERVQEALVDDAMPTPEAAEPLTETAAEPDWPRATPSFNVVLPPADVPIPDATLRVGPRASEFVPDLLDQLLSRVASTVQERALEVAGTDVDARSPMLWRGWLAQDVGVTAREGLFARDLAEYALRDDLDDETTTALRQRLVGVADTGGAITGRLDDVARGPLAALTLAEQRPTVVVRFDAPAWRDARQETGQRSLDVLRAVARVADVHLVISSPELARVLTDRFDLEDDLEFTEVLDATRSNRDQSRRSWSEREAESWSILDEHYDGGEGDLRILASVPDGDYRWQSALARDPDVDLQKAGVSRALGRLEDHGFITRPRAQDGRKRVQLTPLGEAAQTHVTAAYGLRSPLQSTLLGEFTATSRVSAGAVYRAQQGREGGQGPPAAEEWVSSQADAADGEFVRWLDGPDGRLDALAMHKRYVAGARGDISLVDDWHLEQFEDGRVSYLSAFDDEVLVLTQWGGPLPTLARIAATLLSDKALSKLLGPERLGREFEQLQTGTGQRILHAFDDALTAVMRDGMQLGWFGEDEHRWDGWRDRIGGVRARCLSKLADVVGTTDWEERGALMRDLRGLVGIAAQLYRAADMDVVINVRCPDTNNVERDEYRLNGFTDFFKHTVPLTAAYTSSTGVHSHYRQVHETREEKVQWRLPVGYDPSAPASDNRVQWVVSGRAATDLQTHIESSLNPEVRDRVQEGVEDAPHLDVTVANGCTLPAIRDVVREFARKKGKRVAEGDESVLDEVRGPELDRLCRVLLASLGTGDRPNQANPCDVAEAMMYLASSTRLNDYLTVDDLEFALSQLPPERVFPDVTRSGSKLVQALLASDEPLGMSALLEAAGISASTYHRQLPTLEAVGLLQETEVNGRTAWLASLEPWWGTGSERSEPRGECVESGLASGMTESDVAYDIVCALDLDVDSEVFCWPPDVQEAYRDPELRGWRAWIWAHTAPPEALLNGPPDAPPALEPRPIRLGYREEQRDAGQRSLVSSANASVKVTDGGSDRSQ